MRARMPRACLDPGSGYLAKIILLLGLAYPLSPLDIVPNRIPFVGYADQVGFVLGGIILSYVALPRTRPRRTVTLRARFARWSRAMCLDGVAWLLAAPMLRLATGTWPQAARSTSSGALFATSRHCRR